ncbi:MAG: ROK family transcriptional regulator [Thermotogaceae bacterium]|nr:ROK family transcriptional regulator [Thermotogaceae bacterium]
MPEIKFGFVLVQVYKVNVSCMHHATNWKEGVRMNQTQHKILSLIWKKEKLSIKDISYILGVDTSTVSRNIRVLLRHDYVVEAGEMEAGPYGGRKARIYSANPDKFKVLGIGVEQSEMVFSIINAKGEIIFSKKCVCNLSRENLVERIVEYSREFIDDKVLAVSVSMPGIIDTDKGCVLFSAALGLKDFDLKSKLEKKIKKEVFLLNDANAAASLYTSMWNNLIYFLITVPYDLNENAGLGAGIIINGKIYTGSAMSAGEFPLNTLPPLLEKDQSLYRTFSDIKLGKLSYEQAKTFVDKLIENISKITYVLDPEAIILGGDISVFKEDVYLKIKDDILAIFNQKPQSRTVFTVDENGLETVANGGARAILNRFIDEFEFAYKIMKDGGLL